MIGNELEKEKEGLIEIGVGYMCGGEKTRGKKSINEIKKGKIILKNKKWQLRNVTTIFSQ